ncbi:MAG: DUF6134 family protein [Owenweeksia sp.]|nr:DUF6134 family protein [Owenweeksia sp.]
MWYLYLIIFWLGTSVDIPLQDHQYDIIVQDVVMGQATASTETKGAVKVYRNTSVSQINFLKKIEVKLEQKAVYENGLMQYAETKTMVNDRLHRHIRIQKVEDGYRVTTSDDSKKVKVPIRYSGILLMLKEPVEVSRSYSENDAEFHKIEALGEGRYLKTAPNGRKNYYQYRNGKLVEATVDAGWYTFEMQLQKN